MPLLTNSVGQKSVSVTFAWIAFIVTTIAYIMGMFESIGPVTFRPFDTSACAAFLIPVLGLYFGRRWTEKNVGNEPGKPGE